MCQLTLEDTQHLEMSKKAHAHSPQLSNKILKSIRTAKETGLVEARENHHLYAASRRDPDWRSLRGLPKKGKQLGQLGKKFSAIRCSLRQKICYEEQ